MPALPPSRTIFDGTDWVKTRAGDFDEDAYARFMREHDNHWL